MGFRTRKGNGWRRELVSMDGESKTLKSTRNPETDPERKNGMTAIPPKRDKS